MTPPRHWCHQCQRAVNVDSVSLQCSTCNSDFVEEITEQDNPQEWFSAQAIDPIQEELQAFLQAIGASSGSLVVNRTPGAGPRQQIITFQRPPNSSSPSPLPNPNPITNPSFNQLMMTLMGMMQAPQSDPELDTLIARIMESDPNRWGPPPASATAVEGLDKITISQEHIDKEMECAVCMDAFVVESVTFQMPCAHLFHENCLRSWLGQHNSCPVCRHELPTDDADYERIRANHRSQAQAGPSSRTSASTNTNSNSNAEGGSANHGLRQLFSRLSRSSNNRPRHE